MATQYIVTITYQLSAGQKNSAAIIVESSHGEAAKNIAEKMLKDMMNMMGRNISILNRIAFPFSISTISTQQTR